MGRLEKMKRIIIEEANKRVLNEGWFSRKKKIKSFQDYNDYVNGIDTTINVYQKGDKFLVTRRGHEEYVIKTFDNVGDALSFASDMSDEEKFRTDPEHFTHNDEGMEINEQNFDPDRYDETEEYGTDLDGGGEDNVEYNITLQLNRTLIHPVSGHPLEMPEIEAEELLDIPDSYEEGIKIFQQIKDKLGRNKR